METYGSDKPDPEDRPDGAGCHRAVVRLWLRPFEGNVVKAIVVTDFAGSRKQIDGLCAEVEVQSGNKGYWFRYDEKKEIVGGIAKFVAPMKDQVVEALGLVPGCLWA